MSPFIAEGDVGRLEPKIVWQIFAGLSRVPRASKQEARIRAHVRGVAEQAGLKVREDRTGNIAIDVPATSGFEAAPITVLQGHLDMVCEKNSGTEHDFDRDPIRLVVDKEPVTGEEIVRAQGTTLGADNGIGVAMALGVAMTPSIEHGPLELLFTVDEEAGMTGAKALAPGFVKGRRMINLDSEEDEAIYIGCAGGCDVNVTWNAALTACAKGGERVRVSVSGLRGGHSGSDIKENRGNAIKILAATLLGAGVDGVRIAELSGGSKRNAIPREASAVVCGTGGLWTSLAASGERVQADSARDHSEPGLRIVVEREADPKCACLSAADSEGVLRVLAGVPSSVLGMHPKVEGLVQTSNNLSTVSWRRRDNGASADIEVGTLVRSSSEWLKACTIEQVRSIGRLGGGSVSTANEYPGWDPNVDSILLATGRRVYEKLFGAAPHVLAIHAGLECGIIGERMPGMDTISIGPTIRGAHSPDERVYVASVQKAWRFLQAVLEELGRG